MKWFNLMFLCFSVFYLGCNSRLDKNVDNNRVYGSSEKVGKVDSDMFFLLKNEFPKRPNYFHHVYESRDTSKYHNLVPKIEDDNFSLSNNPSPVSRKNIEKVDLLDIPIKWTEVIFHSNKFYLKYPSDFCGLNQRIITDSCLITLICEGPYPQFLKSIYKRNSIQYNIRFGNFDNDINNYQITIIDSINGVAIWKNENFYTLLADVSRFKNLPLAVSDCNGGNKCPFEIESEKMDYPDMIKEALKAAKITEN